MIVLIIVIICIACFTAYKYGEIHELHKLRAEFEQYIKVDPCDSIVKPGLEAAENIVDRFIEDEKYSL